MLCELHVDVLGFIISLVCSHRVLCICAQASSKLRTEATRIMQSRYTEESAHVERLIGKLQLLECSNGASHDHVQFKSVEWLKHMLGWVDHEPMYRHNNDMILDLFYCDCRSCHRTLPCGRGRTRCLSQHEESLINHHFKVRWWDECGY